jgi:tetratricopeptide (TPR) repeat protein
VAAPDGRRRALLASFAFATSLQAQAAIDPNIAPRAAALEREGERPMAIDLLGRYLATAPDDGSAWLQLGRFYLADARDWHVGGHRGEPGRARTSAPLSLAGLRLAPGYGRNLIPAGRLVRAGNCRERSG